MNPIDFFLDPLHYGFLSRALLVTLVASVTCALLSCWLVQIGWSLMGDAVSHSVLPGVVLAYLIGWPFAIGAFIFGVGAVALIGGVRGSTKLKADAAIGVVFTILFALGLVLLSVTPSQTDLLHILFGNVLGVTPQDLWPVLVIGALVCTALLVKRHDLTLYAFDRNHAHALGINNRALSALLLGCLALTVVVALQAVGVILAVAMLVIPGSTALLLTRRMSRLLFLAALITSVCSVVGVYASYYLNVSTGGAVVLAQGAAFVLAFVFGSRGALIPRLQQKRLRSVSKLSNSSADANLEAV